MWHPEEQEEEEEADMANGLRCHCCSGVHSSSAAQSLSEIAFSKSLAGAAQAGDVARMKTLLEKGVNPDGSSEDGYAPLHFAARNGHLQACRLLLQVSSFSSQFLLLVHPIISLSIIFNLLGRCIVLHTLYGSDTAYGCKYGASADRRTRAGNATSLHRAAYAGYEEVAVLLLEHGANPSAVDADGFTPIDKAGKQGHLSLERLLHRIASGKSESGIGDFGSLS